MTKICLHCGKEFAIKDYNYRTVYCSRECFYSSRIGRKLSEESRKKMSLAAKGKSKSQEHRQHVSDAIKKKWQDAEYVKMMRELHTGSIFSEETRKKMSLAHGATACQSALYIPVGQAYAQVMGTTLSQVNMSSFSNAADIIYGTFHFKAF